MNRRAARALMRAQRSAMLIERAVTDLLAHERIPQEAANLLLLEIADARREMAHCASDLISAAGQVENVRRTACDAAALAIYGTLSQADQGRLYGAARKAGVWSIRDFLKLSTTKANEHA